METKTWFALDAHKNRIFRRPSAISIKGWTALEPRHGGRPVLVQRAPGDPVPPKCEIIINGAMADYEEALVRARKDETGMTDTEVDKARDHAVLAILEAPIKTKFCDVDRVKTKIRPRSFSTSAVALEKKK